jgi:hypothetical protein
LYRGVSHRIAQIHSGFHQPSAGRGSFDPVPTEEFLVLITCRDEKEQLELLGRLKEEGRECKAMLA